MVKISDVIKATKKTDDELALIRLQMKLLSYKKAIKNQNLQLAAKRV